MRRIYWNRRVIRNPNRFLKPRVPLLLAFLPDLWPDEVVF